MFLGLFSGDIEGDNAYYTNLEPFDKTLMETEEFKHHKKDYESGKKLFPLFKDLNRDSKGNASEFSKSFLDSISDGIMKPSVIYVGKNHFWLPHTKSLCSGEKQTLRPAELDQDIKCLLVHHFDPFLVLNPFKVELTNREPIVYTCHDFLSEPEIQSFLSLSVGRMKNTPIPINSNRSESYSKHRTSKIFYGSDEKHPDMKKLSRRLELMTSLSLVGPGQLSQNYQVPYTH